MDASRTRARRTYVPLTALACSLALLSGCSGADTSADGGRTTAQAAQALTPRSGADLQSDYLKVIKDVLPSVVQIQARNDLGSGVVFDGQGHIVTNAHVVGSQKTFKVTTANTEETLSARLVSSYPEQDLAVVKLDKVPHGLKAASFGDSAKVEVGQIVLAMGSPLGLSSSVTEGIVSATGRTVTEGSSGGGTGATIGNMVQTSAAINPGNSGGALVNLSGQVIGIPTLAATDPDLGGSAAPGIGFAIPASMVRTIAEQIVKDGKVTDSGRAALGITGRTVVDDSYQAAGVAVVEVKAGGAAAKAGIESGDIVVGLGSTPITTITSLSEALAAEKPGDKVTVTYTRGGSRKKADVTLGEQ
ncbi:MULTISPECIES: S1C family serine protease [Streptomyces]|uniref:Trypsin-like peptidase domain-containing protein n=1 Tax=Streptomyces doudnae TaxID=3075536 RepID=A0ABD5ELQ0_9ACTN|nr:MULTISPECIES: trypsin-like peptidase domain-containing protein [unclassified Streptomyces]MDT0435228.1 trypsin-like peptidase domain-containing protein [Streptomyces sp. DSM 41981]MYQ64368.1 PDZ domain-containing protein [Streptomyces sp. SID4950]SCD77529.1 serine protease, S1-C subfamily, contains C-terminal PDZ domain [Streptomyces sp. SolWspMP-5a-2]